MTKKFVISLVVLALQLGCAQNPNSNDTDNLPVVRSSVLDEFPDFAKNKAFLEPFSSCDGLLASFKNNYLKEVRKGLVEQFDFAVKNPNGFYGVGMPEAAGGAMGAAPATSPSASADRVAGVDFSGSNNQEAGIDEADFVKTDGNFIYVLNGTALEIMGVPEAGQIDRRSHLVIGDSPIEMMLYKDRLVIFSSQWTNFGIADSRMGIFPAGASRIKISVVSLDVERRAPRLEKEWWMDGGYRSARLVGSKILIVSHFADRQLSCVRQYLQINYDTNGGAPSVAQLKAAFDESWSQSEACIANAGLKDFIPQISEAGQPRDIHNGDCSNISAPVDVVSRGLATVTTLDMSAVLSPQFSSVLSNYPTIYASSNVLILADLVQPQWFFGSQSRSDELTNIHRFAVSGVGETTYSGSGRVPGQVSNQFAISEYKGAVRVATTTGLFSRLPNGDSLSENHVLVMQGDSELAVVGRIDGIAPGEKIWSSRFNGDRGFLVTAKNTDPLFTLDLASPTQPRIVGELKVTGVSTYIHLLGDNHLLTVGYGGNDERINFNTTVSIFDISDFSNPRLASNLPLMSPAGSNGWQTASSEANYEHKAITYFAPLKLLAIPLSVYQEIRGVTPFYNYRNELILIHAESGVPLTVSGRANQNSLYNALASNVFYAPDIRRSIFVGSYVYVIGELGVTVHTTDTYQATGEVRFEITENPYPYSSAG